MGNDLIPEGINQREEDGYFNATAMCKAAGKKWSHYWSNDTTKAFMEALSAKAGIPAIDLIQSLRGGTEAGGGTWVHPLVARHLAQWLSPEYAVAVAMLLEAHHTGQLTGKTQAPPALLEQRMTCLIEALEAATNRQNDIINLSRSEQASFIGQAKYAMLTSQQLHEMEMALRVTEAKLAFAEAKANQCEAERNDAVGKIKTATGAYKERGKEIGALKKEIEGLKEALTTAGVDALKVENKILMRAAERLVEDFNKAIKNGSGAAYRTIELAISGIEHAGLRQTLQEKRETEKRKRGFGVVDGGRAS